MNSSRVERFVYAYYGGIDKIAHERGFGDFYDAELRAADRLVGDLLEVLPPGAVLLVTADHGQVEVGDNIVTPSAELLSLVSLQSGEGRFRWLHARRGATDELLAAAIAEFGDTAWVHDRRPDHRRRLVRTIGGAPDRQSARRRRDRGAPARELPRSARQRSVRTGLSSWITDLRRDACPAGRGNAQLIATLHHPEDHP